MQRTECSCASVELVKGRVSSRITTDKIIHGLEIRRGKSLGLFTRSSLIGTLMRAGLFIAAIPILASAQTHEEIAAMQAQIAAQQAQKNADRALLEQLDAKSQRDALQALQEDTTLAASQRDALQNQPKTGKAGANPSQQNVASPADQSQPQQEYWTPATYEALPVTLPPAAASPSPSPAETRMETTPVQEGGTDATPRPVVLEQDGGAATPDKVPEGGGAQHDEAPAVTPAAPRPKALGRHEHGLRPAARPQPQPTFWQRLFGRKETKEAKNAKPGKPRQ
jgi:hypothetical protein